MQKRGAEINITTIIIIILALLVLVIIALYFTGGMKSLWQRITGAKGAWDQADVEQAREVCKTYCTGLNKEMFCYHDFIIKATDGKSTVKMRCTDKEIAAYKTEECKRVEFTKEMCEELEKEWAD
ncbi:MAG: hypothetical protein NZ889_00290 [Candidatus Pacearchaeota archaeon]|nr:hypothetical protein [Candidatus Pacearchaeota archaeon]